MWFANYLPNYLQTLNCTIFQKNLGGFVAKAFLLKSTPNSTKCNKTIFNFENLIENYNVKKKLRLLLMCSCFNGGL